MSRLPLPSDEEGMLSLLSSLSDDELEEMLNAANELEVRINLYGPQTDDELHEWIKAEMGLDIPRVSVCEGHSAPFNLLADLFFERVDAALGVANRGGSKTFIIAVLHWVNSKFKPGVESCTFGAIEAQSFRAYAHLKGWIYDKDGEKKPDVVSSLMRETILRNGSRIEVLGSTPEAVNGPHPQKSHADEIELMRDDTWRESRNMTVSKKIVVGTDPDTGAEIVKLIKPQDIATSTRKGPSGRVQALIDEIEEAVRQGYDPPRTLYIWCIKETASERPNCREVPDAIRQKRLTELGMDPCDLCDCDRVRKGEWDDGRPRLLSDVCGGDFFKSRGWQPPEEIKKQFRENDRNTFEVQQLCDKPEMKFHYVPTWKDAKHCIRGYDGNPENGPIFTATDWGGTNPHAVNWYQLLTNEIEVATWVQPEGNEVVVKRLPEGSIVCFDEIYIAEIGNDKLGKMVIAKEDEYRAYWSRRGKLWRVADRFADPQGKAARTDWRELGLVTTWHTTREFDEHIKVIRSLFDDELFYVDGEKCPMFVREIKAWRKDERTGNQLDEFNHAMSEFRYAVANIRKVKRKLVTKGTSVPTAKSKERRTRVISSRPPAPVASRGGKDEFARWRKNLGSPETR